jgi:uncharacterized OB-fold protein
VTQSVSASLPTPAPLVNAETQTFWEATTDGKLMLAHCNACDTLIWYPRLFCPLCNSFDVGWVQASGKGKIYSYTVNRRGQGDYRDLVFVLAYVELDEGPRMLTNIVDCDLDKLAVGQAVQVVFHDTGKGSALPRFRPADG